MGYQQHETLNDAVLEIISAGHFLILHEKDNNVACRSWIPLPHDGYTYTTELQEHIKDWLDGNLPDHVVTPSKYYCLLHFKRLEDLVQFKLSFEMKK